MLSRGRSPLPEKPVHNPQSVIHTSQFPNLTGQPQRLQPEPSPAGASYHRRPTESVDRWTGKVAHATE